MKLKVMLMVLLFLPLMVQAQTSVDRNWRTCKPTTGTPVVAYHWQISVDTIPFNWTQYATTDDTTLTVNVPYDWTYVVRVQAADDHNRLGPWSEVSDPDMVVGPGPGVCCKPNLAGN